MKAVLIGDRLTGAGYRLAGVDLRRTDVAGAPAAFEDACATADLVLITAPLADAVPAEALERAIRRSAPPVQVIPALTRPRYAPDVRRRVRRALGVGS